MKKIDLNSLIMFGEVLDAGGITGASAANGIPKSTISRRISALERRLGAQLLKRNSHKLSPTAFGIRMYDYYRRISAEVANADDYVENLRTDAHGTLRIAVPAEIGILWLGKVIAEFTRARPHLEIEIGLAVNAIDLVKDPYDIALHFGQLRASRLISKRVTTLKRGLYASPAYLERCGIPETPDDLRNHECVITNLQQTEGTWTFRRADQRRKLRLVGRLRMNNIRLARELVLEGVGIGVLTEVLCAADVSSGRLLRVLPNWDIAPLQLTALLPSRDRIPRSARAFLDLLTARMRERDI